MRKEYNRKIDVIIPAYNVPESIIFRCLSSIACQTLIDDLEITIVDDASDKEYVEGYKKVIGHFNERLKINLLRYEINGGPGVARQYGIDHTNNGYMTFIDADDTLNGAFALQALRNSIEMDKGNNIMSVGVFDEVHGSELDNPDGPFLIPHEKDMVWMFGKLYRRSFVDKYDIKFHPTSRANEDNGFNTIIRLIANDQENIKLIPTHVYYWHENPNSITRANDHQYSYGGSIRDSFYGFVENMIYAIKEAKVRCPYNGNITKWAVNTMVNIYQYYIEGYAMANEHAENNFKWCKRYYDEIFKDLENTISKEILAQHYGEVMRNSYLGDGPMNVIVPHIGLYEFLDALKDKVIEEE